MQTLKQNINEARKFNVRASKGNVTALRNQLRFGSVASVGLAMYKAHKKEIGLKSREFIKLYGVAKTYFYDTISASKLPEKVVTEYINSLEGEPTASIIGLLKFAKGEVDKPKNLISFSVAKTETDKGLSARIDATGNLNTKASKEDLLIAIAILQQSIEAMTEVVA